MTKQRLAKSPTEREELSITPGRHQHAAPKIMAVEKSRDFGTLPSSRASRSRFGDGSSLLSPLTPRRLSGAAREEDDRALHVHRDRDRELGERVARVSDREEDHDEAAERLDRHAQPED